MRGFGCFLLAGLLALPACAAAAGSTAKPHKAVHKASHPAVVGASGKHTAGAAAGATGSKRSASMRARTRKGRATSKSRASAPSYQLHPDPERYGQIQQSLADRGFYKGSTDGTWNDDSVQALRTFQGANNLEADGKINSLTLMKLGLGPKHDGSGAPLSGAGTATPVTSPASETPLPPPPTSLPPESDTAAPPSDTAAPE